MTIAEDLIYLVLFGAMLLLILDLVNRVRMHKDGERVSGMLSAFENRGGFALPKKCCSNSQITQIL
jgi:hypothetical protein